MIRDPFRADGPTPAGAARSASCALDAVFPETAPDDAYILLSGGARVTAGEVRRLARALGSAVDETEGD